MRLKWFPAGAQIKPKISWIKQKTEKSIRETCPHFQCGTRQSLVLKWAHHFFILVQFCTTLFGVWYSFVPEKKGRWYSFVPTFLEPIQTLFHFSLLDLGV
uniref:hypothetical protein n=1 Tax=Planococcus sp. (in: firmicutes) TaxID=1871321 RepID=UPI0015EFA6E6|nr:hypothetical protein [Planococcus sp. (in: firmicutes)]